MAAAVLDDLRAWSLARIQRPLAEPGDPRAKLQAMTAALSELYDGGQEPCLIGLFSIGEPLRQFQGSLKEALSGLAAAIEGVLLEAGIAADVARQRAEDAVIRIQGALVFARIMEDTGPFERLLRRLPEQLLEAQSRRRR